MIFDYFVFLSSINCVELLLQTIILFNAIQILKQTNFYFLLAYFFLYLLFNGIYLIYIECALITILLWLIYFGVIIIFFAYSLIWFETNQQLKQNYSIWNFYFWSGFICLLIFFIFVYFSIPTTLVLDFLYSSYINYYELLFLNLNEELDGLGYAIILYSSFLFLLCIYILFIACCISVALVLMTKKIKYLIYFYYIKGTTMQNRLKTLIIYKTQYFFIQDYENTYQVYSLNKNFKIIHKFHRVKTVSKHF